MRFRIAILAVLLVLRVLRPLRFPGQIQGIPGRRGKSGARPEGRLTRRPSGRSRGCAIPPAATPVTSGESGSWPTDFPKADRQFLQGVRRLTRIHTRSTEQVIDLINDPDEIFNWPWVYAVEVGHWDLTDEICKTLREYLLRGGFLMVDDFHGTFEWDVFTQSMSRIFPDRTIVELPDADPIFHTVYDLDHRVQVPGLQYLYSGRIYENGSGNDSSLAGDL